MAKSKLKISKKSSKTEHSETPKNSDKKCTPIVLSGEGQPEIRRVNF